MTSRNSGYHLIAYQVGSLGLVPMDFERRLPACHNRSSEGIRYYLSLVGFDCLQYAPLACDLLLDCDAAYQSNAFQRDGEIRCAVDHAVDSIGLVGEEMLVLVRRDH